MIRVKTKDVVALTSTNALTSAVGYSFSVDGYYNANQGAGAVYYVNFAAKLAAFSNVYEQYTMTFLKVRLFPSQYASGPAQASLTLPYHVSIDSDVTKWTTANTVTVASVSAESKYKCIFSLSPCTTGCKVKYYLENLSPALWIPTNQHFVGSIAN